MPATDPTPPCAYLDPFAPDHPHPAVADWQRHVDAGRIGARVPMDPAVLASILAAEAVVRRRR